MQIFLHISLRMYFSILSLISCFIQFDAKAIASSAFVYDEKEFLNKTMNGMGYEFQPFEKGSNECIEHIKSLSPSKISILEIGGCYGRLMCQIYDAVPRKNRENLHYDFFELDTRHLNIAQAIFEARFGTQHVNFTAGDAAESLRSSNIIYDVILAFNVFHYLAPSKFVLQSKLIFEKLKIGGKLFGVAMTPYYNIHKKTIKSIKPGPIPLLPEEELNRQVFEYQTNSRFPGCFCARPFEDHSLNYINKSVLEDVLATIGLTTKWVNEFSIDDQDYISSEKRWVAFEATKTQSGQNIHLINMLYKAALESERQTIKLYDIYLDNVSTEEIYDRWFAYINQMSGKEVVKLKVFGEILK